MDQQAAVLTVEEAKDVLRIGRSTMYELLRRKEIPSLRLGRVIRIPRQALNEYIGRSAAKVEPDGR